MNISCSSCEGKGGAPQHLSQCLNLVSYVGWIFCLERQGNDKISNATKATKIRTMVIITTTMNANDDNNTALMIDFFLLSCLKFIRRME